MEFGMFHQFPSLPGRADADSFAEAFAQIDAAEELGLDVMWLAELHFDPQRSVLSAPLSIASAIAARTRRIKIGIAVQVLPLCHPLRLAEEAATVDQISRGRLIFGVGRSGLPRTYEDYGVSYAESRDRFAEVLDIIEQAWSQPAVSYEGRYYSFNNIAVTPKPFQQPLPQIRIAAASPDTYPAVGERGLPIFINARHGAFAEFVPGDPRVSRGLQGGRPSRNGPGVSAGADLSGRHRGPGARGAAGEPDAFLPRADRAAAGLDVPRRHPA